MEKYPLATWHASPNYTQGRQGQAVGCITDHIMQGSMASSDSWFLNIGSQVSAHFGVAKDGSVIQWVDTDNSAWVNGNINQPDLSVALIDKCSNENIWPNAVTLGIEHEGYTGQPLTEVQYQATLALHRWLLQLYPQQLKSDRQHILGHYQWDNVTRHDCPGASFPFDRLISDLSGGLKPVNPTPPTPITPQFLYGDGVKALATQHGDTIASNEDYFTSNHKAGWEVSHTYFKDNASRSGIYVWSNDTNSVHRYLIGD